MGCGGNAKATSNTVSEVPRVANKSLPPRQHKRPTHYVRFKLEPEVLDGFARLLRRTAELAAKPQPAQAPKPLQDESREAVPVTYNPPAMSNPFTALINEDTSAKMRLQATLDDHRYSPEPPRPESDSSDDERQGEDEARRAERLQKEREAREEAERLAERQRLKQEELARGRKGLITGMDSEAKSILSKYQN